MTSMPTPALMVLSTLKESGEVLLWNRGDGVVVLNAVQHPAYVGYFVHDGSRILRRITHNDSNAERVGG